MRLRKKIFFYSQQIYFIILYPVRLFRHQNDGIRLSPHSHPAESPCLSLLHHACMFLVGYCVWNIKQQLFKATTFFFCCCSVCRPKQWYGVRPTRSSQVVRPPQYPSYPERQLLVGCCVVQPKDGHLRPRSHLSHYVLMCCVLVPQTKEQKAKRAHPMPHDLYGPIGISNAKIWVHGGCCHGKRWQSCWKVGWWWLMLAVVCFVFFVLCVVFERPVSYRRVENWYRHKPNCQLLCAIIT